MKTIDEIAKEYAEKTIDTATYASVNELREYAETDFKAGVEFAQRWIPVEEELPENNVPVIMKNQYGFYGIGEIKNEKWRFFSVESYSEMLNLKMHTPEQIAKVTHWRPINLE